MIGWDVTYPERAEFHRRAFHARYLAQDILCLAGLLACYLVLDIFLVKVGAGHYLGIYGQGCLPVVSQRAGTVKFDVRLVNAVAKDGLALARILLFDLVFDKLLQVVLVNAHHGVCLGDANGNLVALGIHGRCNGKVARSRLERIFQRYVAAVL